MEVLGVLGTILLGIAVISGLMKEGAVGRIGGCLMIFLLIVIILGIGLVLFIMTIGGDIL